MLRWPLIFTFMVTTLFSCTFAEVDIIKSAIEDLTKGARLSQNLTDHLRTAAKNIENSMEKAERGMLDLTEKINSLGTLTIDSCLVSSLLQLGWYRNN